MATTKKAETEAKKETKTAAKTTKAAAKTTKAAAKTTKAAEEKKTTKKAAEEKKTTKKAAAKTAAKATEKKAAAEKKAPAKKTATKKAAPAKKTAAKSTKTNVDVFVEFGGVQVSIDEVVKNIKLTNGKAAKDITVYLKPEESKAYFVADGEEKEMDVFFC